MCIKRKVKFLIQIIPEFNEMIDWILLFQALRVSCNEAFVCNIIPFDVKEPVRVWVEICLDIGSALLLIPWHS